MKKGKSIDLDVSKIGPAISRLVYRYHVVLFVVVVVGSMAVVVFLLNNTILNATDTTQVMPPAVQPFDQATIDELSELDDTNSSTDISLPSGRINPFSE